MWVCVGVQVQHGADAHVWKPKDKFGGVCSHLMPLLGTELGALRLGGKQHH